MTYREQLDAQMRDVLNQLRICSHVPAGPYEPIGRSRATEGGDWPPGDKGATKYEHAYGPPFHECEPRCRHYPAATDEERAAVLEEARAELEHIRGHGFRPRLEGETEADLVKRMLRDGRGLSPEAIATSSFRMSARTVRRYRRLNNVDPETGDPFTELAPVMAGRQARDSHLVDLVDRRGYSVADAARKAGVSVSTVKRALRARRHAA